MKRLRIWLLLLLAVLIPVRGAMAASSLCLPPGSVQGGIAAIEHHGGGMASPLHDHEQHGHAIGVSIEQNEDSAFATPDDCNLCASFCTLTPLASASLDLRHPHAQATLNPAPSVPAPSFVSDGEERPPRTI